MIPSIYFPSPCEREEIKEFIEAHHYSGSINGVKDSYCFKLTKGDELVGAMVYGDLGMANTWKKYVEKREDLLELRRLCLIDDTPKNTESFFIGWTLRWLKRNTHVKCIVSYADPNHGHEGTIYKASNFEHVGLTAKGKMINCGGRLYHDKTIRTKYKGELKPFAKRIKESLDKGEAYYVNQVPKHIYLYRLKK